MNSHSASYRPASLLKYKSDRVPPLLNNSWGSHVTWNKSPSPVLWLTRLHDLGSPQPCSPVILPDVSFPVTQTSCYSSIPQPCFHLRAIIYYLLEYSSPEKPLSRHPSLFADLTYSERSSLITLVKNSNTYPQFPSLSSPSQLYS